MTNFQKPIKYTTTDDYITISDYFDQSVVEIIPPINPYAILEPQQEDTVEGLRVKFWYKIATRDRQQRALVSLAYPILCSIVFKAELPKYFKQISPTEFSFDADDPVIMATTGQCKALSDKIDEDRNVALTKSAAGESLLYLACRSGYVDVVYMLCNFGVDINAIENGSTALHAATFFNHKDLAQFLIESGVSLKTKNKFGHYPVQEAPENLKCLFDITKFDPLTHILQRLLEHPLALKLEHIFFEKEIVAYRIQRKIDLRQEIINSWVRGWHGTKSQFLNSIFQYGLLTPGERAGDKKVEILKGHIPGDATVSGIKNYANAIFISTSIYYSSHQIYSQLIETPRGNWRVMIEVGVRQNSYILNESTAPFISAVKGDVEDVEVRIESSRETFNYDESNNVTSVQVKNGVNVVVLAAVLVREEFIKKTAEFANSEKQSKKVLPDGSNVWNARTAKVILNGIDETRKPASSILPRKKQKPTDRPAPPSITPKTGGVSVVRPADEPYFEPIPNLEGTPNPLTSFPSAYSIPAVVPPDAGSSPESPSVSEQKSSSSRKKEASSKKKKNDKGCHSN